MNREAERKRLVELIDKAHADYVSFSTEMALAGNYDGVGTFGEFASKRLLGNGIVVPPFKIGETLHDISEYVYGIPSPEIYEMENDRMTIEKLENGDFIFIYEDAEIRHEDMGVTIFTSREDVLKALEGR